MVDSLTILAQQTVGLQEGYFQIMGFLGICSVIGALFHQYTAGRRNEGLQVATVMGLIFGSLMFAVPNVAEIFGGSLFGTNEDSIIITSYVAETGANARVRESVHAIVAICTLLGWIAIGRGLYIGSVGAKYQQHGWQGSSLTFIVAGTIATNLYVFADILGASVGMGSLGTDYFKFNY